jgi:endonuclease YncB( thermonuclease family)
MALLVMPATLAAAQAASDDPVDPPLPTAQCRLEEGATLVVEDVVDAENLRLDDGREYHLGILASRPDDLASKRALQDLTKGRAITLYHEKGRSKRHDRYDRLNGHAVVSLGRQKVWLQGRLVGDGRARVTFSAIPLPCSGSLLNLEEQARRNRRGHWDTGVFDILPANRPQQIAARLGRFAIVEGRVFRVGKSKGRVYLNFGEDWRKDFTVRIPRGHYRSAVSRPEYQQALPKKGERIRVRGWIEQRGGPLIEILHFGQIERLDRSGPSDLN